MAALGCEQDDRLGLALRDGFEGIVSQFAAIRGYGPLPGLSERERDHAEELAQQALEAWSDARRWNGALDPATPLQRALAEYHDLLMRV